MHYKTLWQDETITVLHNTQLNLLYIHRFAQHIGINMNIEENQFALQILDTLNHTDVLSSTHYSQGYVAKGSQFTLLKHAVGNFTLLGNEGNFINLSYPQLTGIIHALADNILNVCQPNPDRLY